MLEKYFYHKRKLIYNINAGFLLKEIYLIYIILVITWIDPLNILNRIDSMTYGSHIRFIFIQINTENTKSIFFTINKIMQILLIKNTHFDFSVKYNFMEE